MTKPSINPLAFEEWLQKHEAIRPLAEKCPPGCYRGENGGHYLLQSYEEDGTMTMLHGADSFMPGYGVFGFKPELLKPCNCGEWAYASEEQIEQADQRVNDFKALMAGFTAEKFDS